MPNFQIIVPIVGLAVYEVIADCEEEAIKAVHNCEGEPTATDYCEDIDVNNWAVSVVG